MSAMQVIGNPTILELTPAKKATAGNSLEFPTLSQPLSTGKDETDFAAVLSRALNSARDRDVAAQTAVEAFATGEDPGRIHEVMIAVSKAEIALRTVASIRNRLLEAYRDLQHVTA